LLRIRFARTGKKKQANYRIVVADQRSAVTAKFNEILGWYNPHTKEVGLDKEKTESWLQKGANPTNSVAKILKSNGVTLPKWVEIVEKNKKPKKEVEEKVEAKKEETPSEEVKADIVEEKTEEEAEEGLRRWTCRTTC